MPQGAAGAVGNLSERTRFKRALTLLAMTLVFPGSAQVAAGNKRVGRFAWRMLLVIGGLLVAFVLGLALFRAATINLLFRSPVLIATQVLLVAAALGWGYLFVDAFRLGRPALLSTPHRSVAAVLGGLVAFVVVGALGFAAILVNTQRDVITSVFGGKTEKKAEKGRFNVLLLGGDAGPNRSGIRPDSITIASIDADTGRTVLIGLPRNIQKVPFPAGTEMYKHFPKGFTNCGFDGCYLNGINTWANDHPKFFPGAKYPGIQATTQAVQGITGLKINYFVMVDLGGFKELVDAVGGIRMNVGKKVPIGGIGSPVVGYIQPGKNVRLTGYQALWFARSRVYSSDYERMARQKCVMSAMLNQLDPLTVLTKFNRIAAAGKQIVETDIPSKSVGTFTDLALKAKRLPVSSFSAVPPLVNTSDPNFSVIRQRVGLAVAKSEWLDAKAAGKSDDQRKTNPPSSAASRPPATNGTGDQPTKKPSGQPATGSNRPVAEVSDVGKVCSAG